MRNRLAYTLVVLLTCLSLGFAGFASGFSQGYSSGGESEFYHGWYAACLIFATNFFWLPLDYAIAECHVFTDNAIELDGYHEPWDGW